MKKFMIAALALAVGPGAVACAQNVAVPPIRGVITAVSDAGLTLTDSSGASEMIGFLPGVKVVDVKPASLADVKPGTYIGTAAIKQPDGAYRAIELQIFPASMKGVGLGTREWNLKPHSTMTNGTVTNGTGHGLTDAGGTVGAVTSNGDATLQVNDGSGQKTILLPQGAPVVMFAPGQMADVKIGAHALIFASRTPDGKLQTGRVNVGVNGLVPPM